MVRFDDAQLPLRVSLQGTPTVRVGSVGEVLRVRNVDAQVEGPVEEDGDVSLGREQDNS